MTTSDNSIDQHSIIDRDAERDRQPASGEKSNGHQPSPDSTAATVARTNLPERVSDGRPGTEHDA